MGLRFIYGKSGTGKSTLCFNEIKQHIKNNEKVYIITPEQFSYSAEKKLLDILEEKTSINAEVISFNRMANRVFTEVGGLNDIIISKSARSMLVYSILEKEKNNLQFLGSSRDNVDLVLKEITEFKKHNITNEILAKNIEKIDKNRLKEKIRDISRIYDEYEKRLKNNYIDEEDILTKLYNKIPESKMFDNSIVYIDEFAGFTKQEYNIFTEILKKAKQVNVMLCTDNLDYNTNKEEDIFYFNKQFAKKITECYQKVKNGENLSTKCGQNVNKIEESSVFQENKYRFKNNELNHLEENIYKNKYKRYDKENSNIELFIANNSYSEIEHVAQEIIKLIMNENYKYSDIAIITKNIENINNIVKAVFSKYNIPVFIDEKSEITENVLIKYIITILEIFTTNWSKEAVFNYIKSGFLDINNNDIYLIENYCRKNRNK